MSDPAPTWRPQPLSWPAEALSDGVVVLDRLTHDDASVVARACNDPEIARWLPVPSPYTEADAHEFIDGRAAEARGGVELTFAVRGTDGRLRGCVGAAFARCRAFEAEIGYWTAPWARRRGVAARATVLLARYVFAQYPRRRIEVVMSAANRPSAAVAERAGARFEGIRRNGVETHGALSNARVYAFLPEDVSPV